MKKFIFISLFLLSLFFLVSCGDQHIKTEYDTSLIDEPIFRYSEISDESYGVSLNSNCRIFKSLVIPTEYKGKPVTDVIELSNMNCEILVISEGITTLCAESLSHSKAKITILPQSLKNIEGDIFNSFDTDELYYNGSLEQWGKITVQPHYGYHPMTSSKKLYLADNKGDIKLDGRKYSSLQTVVIPDSMTEIPNGLLLKASNVEKVILHDKVTKIGEYAFELCTNLKEINIPDSVTEIAEGAFSRCESLESLSLPNSLTKIPHSFAYQSGIKNINIPEDVESIGSNAFSQCMNLTEITLTKKIKNIGNYAFESCDNLKKAFYDGTFEDWIKIEIGPFSNPAHISGELHLLDSNGNIENNNKKYSILREIVIPDGTTRIASYSFHGLKVNHVSLPESIKEIGAGAFYYSNVVWNFELPTHIEKVGEHAFDNCQRVINFTSDSIKEIGEYAFYQSGLTNVDLSNTLEQIGYRAFESCKIRNAIIPAIASGTINDNPMETLEISNGEIPDETLKYCNTLTELKLNNITNIGTNCFYSNNLNSATLSEGISEINEGLFSGSKINDFLIPKSVNKIDLRSIMSSGYLINIYYNGTIEDWCNIEFTYDKYNYFSFRPSMHNLYIKDENGNKEYNSCKYSLLEDVIIPNSITAINKLQFCGLNIVNVTIPSSISYIDIGAFLNCQKLKNVSLHDCEQLDDYAFKECISLENINLETVKTIKNQCFYNCKSLKKAYLNNIESILEGAFENCTSLEELALLGKTTQPSTRAFYNCTALQKIELSKRLIKMNYAFNSAKDAEFYYDGSINDWLKVESDYNYYSIDFNGVSNTNYHNKYFLDSNGDIEFNSKKFKAITSLTIDSIDYNYFPNVSGLKDLKTLIFSEGITDIPSTSFNCLPNLETIVFPSTLKTIGSQCFNNCYSIKELNFPNSLESIGGYSFINCDSVEIINFGESITYLSDSFINCDKLSKVIISNDLSDIDTNIFANCPILTRIYFIKNNDYIINKISKYSSIIYFYTENKDKETNSGKWWYYNDDNEIVEKLI